MPHRTLYLVRHGAYDPDSDEPLDGGRLNDIGRQQSSLLGERLADVSFDHVHHSSSLRAIQTLDVLAFSLRLSTRNSDDLLRECIPCVPADEYLTESQREFFAQLPSDVKEQGKAQAEAAVERFTTPRDTDTRELVVSHGNLINYFVACAMDAPDHAWLRPVDYHCGLTVIRYSTDAPPRILAYNDVGHLPTQLRGIEYPESLRQ